MHNLYFYPLITMDITRQQMSNIAPGKKMGYGPMNTFANVPEFPPADMKVVVRPNFYPCSGRRGTYVDTRF
jgi:hypothetical protein